MKLICAVICVFILFLNEVSSGQSGPSAKSIVQIVYDRKIELLDALLYLESRLSNETNHAVKQFDAEFQNILKNVSNVSRDAYFQALKLCRINRTLSEPDATCHVSLHDLTNHIKNSFGPLQARIETLQRKSFIYLNKDNEFKIWRRKKTSYPIVKERDVTNSDVKNTVRGRKAIIEEVMMSALRAYLRFDGLFVKEMLKSRMNSLAEEKEVLANDVYKHALILCTGDEVVTEETILCSVDPTAYIIRRFEPLYYRIVDFDETIIL